LEILKPSAASACPAAASTASCEEQHLAAGCSNEQTKLWMILDGSYVFFQVFNIY
jgi:hypothetical protein